MTCDKCGKPARSFVPYDRKPARSATDAMTAPLSRSALHALDPEAEAALPWGKHPDDNRWGRMCLDCAGLASGPTDRDYQDSEALAVRFGWS